MAIRTALTLNQDQLSRMVRYVKARIQAIENDRAQWIADRKRFEREWKGDYSDRAENSAVFSKSNESLKLVSAGVDFVQARIQSEIFGSRPWFKSDPRNESGTDPTLSKEITRHLGWKLGPGQIDFSDLAEELILKAGKYGEGVVKVAHKSDIETFERIASVLCYADGEEPVLDESGNPIFEEKGLEEAPNENGVKVVFPAGHPDKILGYSDPNSPEGAELTQQYIWKEKAVEETAVNYVGAKGYPLHYKEFYCPLNVPSIHESDFVAHKTAMRLSTFRSQFGIFDEKDADGNPSGADEKAGIGEHVEKVLRRIKHESTKPKSEGGMPQNSESGEPDVADGDPEFSLLEAYFTYDVRGDGRPVRVFLMLAYDYDEAIFWDYIQNVTPNGAYPFEAVTLIPAEGRWYGISWFEKYGPDGDLQDKLLNQIVYRNDQAANPIKFRRKEAVVQWQDDQPFETHPDTVLDLNDGYSAQDALQTQEIPNLDNQTKFVLETAISNWRMRSGLTTATQGSFGDMPSEKTATGVNQLTNTSNTMFAPMVMNAKRGLEAVLRKVVKFQYAYQDLDEIYTYLEGDVKMIGKLVAERARGLDLDIELTLSNMHQTEAVQKNKAAIEILDQFLATPDHIKVVVAPLYERVIKNLGIDNADQYLNQITEVTMRALTQPEPINDGSQTGDTPSGVIGENQNPELVRGEGEAIAG